VVDATQAQFNNQNTQAQQGLTGNAIAQGALGGNRVGVAQANLSNQQQLAQAPVIAGLYNQSYQNALQTAAQQYQTNPLNAANSIANFGISGQGAALSGAGAQLGAGTLQQQTQQGIDTANYGQYQQAQAYPYQQTQWLAGLQTGVGSNLGGTSSGTTTAPGPNPWSQILGTGVAAAGMFLNRGGAVKGYADGGGVMPRQHLADGGIGGVPWSGAQGWIPQIQIHGGSGPPHASAPSAPQQPAFDAGKFASGLAGLGKAGMGDKFGAIINPEAYGAADGGLASAYGGSSSNPLAGLSAADYGEGFARGGVVGYADGGAPDFSDRFGPAVDDPLREMTRGQGLGLLAGTHGGIAAPASIPGGEPPPDPNAATWDDGQGPIRIEGGRPTGNPDTLRNTPLPANPPGVSSPDDGDLPEGAEPTAAKYPSIGVASAQYKPPYDITAEDYAPAKKDPENSFGLGWLSPNAKTGLLAAGLGMLASRSPNLGNAIGEAGLSGLSAYGSAEEKDRKAADDARKLSLEAKKAANELAHQTFATNESARHANVSEGQAATNQAETARHNRASEDRTKYVPSGSYMTKEGELHPLVMEQATGKFVDGITGQPPEAGGKVIPKGASAGSTMDDKTSDFLAERVLAGDTKALIGLGRGAQGSENLAKIQGLVASKAAARNMDASDLMAKAAEQSGVLAGQRTFGTQTAKMAINSTEAQGALKLGLEASKGVSRTNWVPVNKAIQAYQSGTSDPNLAKFGAANMAIINTYARAISPTGNPTVHDKEHAEQILSTAMGPEAYQAVIEQMNKEIEIAHAAAPKAKQELEDIRKGRKSGESGSAPASSSFTPPPGAIAQTHNGKTYYYDPATKNPYPGQ
jgi:hypothetical protein